MMTREDIIKKAAKEYAIDMEKSAECGTEFTTAEMFTAYCLGAQYADEHPDLYSVTRKAIAREREYLIDKACKWLEENLPLTNANYPERFVKLFKKAMEDNNGK